MYECTPTEVLEPIAKEAVGTLTAGDLQTELSHLTANSETQLELLQNLARYLRAEPEVAGVFHYSPLADDSECAATELELSSDAKRSPRLSRQVAAACRVACQRQQLEVRRLAAPDRIIFAIPIPPQDGLPEAIGIVSDELEPAVRVILLAQLIPSQIALWQLQASHRSSEKLARTLGAIVELLDQLVAASSTRDACQALAEQIATHFKLRRVAIGLRSHRRSSCRLIAVSDLAVFDKKSNMSDLIEAAMNESLLRGVCHFPPETGEPRGGTLAHQTLCVQVGTQVALSIPLRNSEEQIVGVLTMMGDDPQMMVSAKRVVDGRFGTTLDLIRRARGRWWVRLREDLPGLTRKRRVVAGSMLAVSAFLLLLVPINHQVYCECQLEPVLKRYVAAPFEGTLDETFVEPGDVITKGQVLACLDGREINWERARVAAEIQQAQKNRDTAQVARNFADQQIAQLEIERLELELELLTHRAGNLEIKSPMAGVIASGDLKRVEGAPLSIGQTLFEIGTLDQFVVELSVPDEDLAFVARGQRVDVRLDAYPNQVRRTSLSALQPRAEMREQQNVFIAEAKLEDPDGLLRPGMKGRSKIQAGQRMLGWVLFHRPLEYLVKLLSW